MSDRLLNADPDLEERAAFLRKYYVQEDDPHFVYEFWSDGECLYIGCSGRVGNRMATHQRERDWWNEVTRIKAHIYPDYATGREAEAKLIMKFDPRHNKYNAPHYEHPSTSKSWETRRRREAERQAKKAAS